MTAAEQHAEWGASVEPQGEHVLLQVGDKMVALLPDEAQRFAYYLARAYYRAQLIATNLPELPAGEAIS